MCPGIKPLSFVTPSVRLAIDNYFDFSEAIVKVDISLWFYEVESAVRCVPANKVDLRLLSLTIGITQDNRPVGI